MPSKRRVANRLAGPQGVATPERTMGGKEGDRGD